MGVEVWGSKVLACVFYVGRAACRRWLSMRHDKVIYLISSTDPQKDNIGNQLAKPAERKVFGAELAVFSSEHYNAAATGLKPSKRLEIYTQEYKGESKLRYNGTIYNIIRTSLGKTPEKTWLICERVMGNG